MKNKSFFLFGLTLFSSFVWAHDESLHAKDAEAPRCAGMKNMDHSKIEKDDPIMQAMMKKCMHHSGQDNAEIDSNNKQHQKRDSEHTEPKQNEKHNH